MTSTNQNQSRNQSFIDEWVERQETSQALPHILVFREKPDSRERVLAAIREAVRDHLVGLEAFERLSGNPKSIAVIRNKLPTVKIFQSADVGEILGTEYVIQKTPFIVPLKRLRYREDRNVAMRGDDILAVRKVDGIYKVLKGEAKSRASLGKSVVDEAAQALMKDSARPKPTSLGFIATWLWALGKDAEAKIFEYLQTHDIREQDIAHLLFTLSGNDPSDALSGCSISFPQSIERSLVGFVVAGHQSFIDSIFEALDARNP